MKRFFTRTAATGIALLALFTATIVQAGEKKDIVDTAVSAGSFKTLAAALDAADLIPALKGKGPFTVFAPTDEAFAKLPKGTVETLLKPENKDKLTAILTYHVVSGKVAAKQVVGLKGAATLNGQRVDIAVVDGKVNVDKATVVATDIECTNGIIHVIDNVILPSGDDIVTTASNAGTFNTLIAAAKAAGLAGALTSDGPLTVFAPTDDAFAKLPEGTVATLLKPENKGKLAAILKYHVVAGRVYSDQALSAAKATTLQGSDINIKITNGKAQVQNANLVATDIDASNGVIHVIDSVILPPEDNKISAAEARHMIEQAVAKGSKLYNNGHHSECAKVYMSTMREVLAHGTNMPEELVTKMQKYVSAAEHTSCATKQSWTLRAALEQTHARMASN